MTRANWSRGRRLLAAVAVSAIAGALLLLPSPVHGAAPLSAQTVAAAAEGDPVIAAAGDIACDPNINPPDPYGSNQYFCQQRATSDVMLGQSLAAVWPLGDIQYEDATLENFMKVYDPSWGRLKGLTRPVPGNHEYNVLR